MVNHADAVEQLLPAARNKSVGFGMLSALHAGFLGGAPRYNYGASNTLIVPDKCQRSATLRRMAS